MPSKSSQAVNVSAFICSTILVGLAIATIYLASDAYDVFTSRFPPGTYGWSPSHWIDHWIDEGNGWNILLGYNRSSEIKTYVAAAFALAVGLLGSFAFGRSFKVRNIYDRADPNVTANLSPKDSGCTIALDITARERSSGLHRSYHLRCLVSSG
jgi:hypothetical protein